MNTAHTEDVPDQPKTPIRGIRIEDRLWRSAQAKAAERGETVSDVIRRALQRYINTEETS